MPIPVIADHYLSQVIFKSIEGEDVNTFVNTSYWFDPGGAFTFSQVADKLETIWEQFYNGDNGAAPAAITAYMGRQINWSDIALKVYDLGVAAPRIPEVRSLEMTQPSAAGALPNECAIVLSYRSGAGTTGGGSSDPRKRGRMFLGPWKDGAVTFSSGTDGDAKVTPNLLLAIVEAADYLLTEPEDLSWQQYSRVANDMSVVAGGFVDNRFDTQRRRGQVATTRTTF